MRQDGHETKVLLCRYPLFGCNGRASQLLEHMFHVQSATLEFHWHDPNDFLFRDEQVIGPGSSLFFLKCVTINVNKQMVHRHALHRHPTAGFPAPVSMAGAVDGLSEDFH